MYDITYNYDIPFSDIIYYITYDGCMSLPSPPPGLHSGLDSFRYSTIAYENLIFLCRLQSTAHSVPLHSGKLPNAGLFSVMLSGQVRRSIRLASNSGRNTLLIKLKLNTIATSSGVTTLPLRVLVLFGDGAAIRWFLVVVGHGLLAQSLVRRRTARSLADVASRSMSYDGPK